MITKKIGKITFAWDPTALKGKGYWYVKGRSDSYARAATQKEAQKLGKPKEEELPKRDSEKPGYYNAIDPRTGRPIRRRIYTGSQYERADITRSKGLMQLASERVAGGQGMGKALGGAISDKIGAKATSIKRAFDPMNLLSKLPGVGQLAATAYGMKRGRSAADISYFTGIRAPERMEQPEPSQTTSKVKTSSTATSGVSKGAVGVLKNIHKLISDRFEEDLKLRETDKAFKEEEKAEGDRKHKELIDAILKGKKPSRTASVKPENKGLFANLFEMLKGGFSSMFKSIMPVLKAFGSGLLRILSPLAGILAPLALVIGGVVAGAKLIDKGYEVLTGKSSDSYSKTYDPKTTNKEMQSYINQRQMSGASDKATEQGQAKDMEEYKKTGKITNKFTGKDETKQRLEQIDKFKKYKEFKKNDPYQQYKTEVLEVDYKGKKRPTFDEWKSQKQSKDKGNTASAVPAQEKAKDNTATVVPKENKSQPIKTKEEQIYQRLLAESPEEWKKDPSYIQDLKSEAHMEAMQTSAAIPTVTPPSPLGPRAVAATKENQNLVGPSNAPAAPIIINKPTNVVNNGGSMGGTGGGMVRNDDAVLTRLQFQSMRPV